MCSPMLRTLSPTRVMTVAIGSIMFSSLTFSSLDVLNTSCVSLLRWPVGTQYRSCPSMIPHTWALEGLRLLILGPFWLNSFHEHLMALNFLAAFCFGHPTFCRHAEDLFHSPEPSSMAFLFEDMSHASNLISSHFESYFKTRFKLDYFSSL